MNKASSVQTNQIGSLWGAVENAHGGKKFVPAQASGVDLLSNFAYSKSVTFPSFEIRSSGDSILLATFRNIIVRLFYLRTDEIGGTFGFRVLHFSCDSNGWKSRTPLPVGTIYSYDGGQTTEFNEYDSEFMVSCNTRLGFNKLASVPVGNVEFNRVNYMGLSIQGVVWDRC